MQKVKIDSDGIRGVYSVCEVQDGKAHGRYIEFDVNDGFVVRDFNYENDQRHGECKAFYPSGKLQSCAIFANGQRHGAAQSWHENGQLAATSEYVDGKSQGESRTFYPDGTLKSLFTFVDDVVEGKATEYFASGMPKSIFNYKNGEQDGECTEYYENGKPRLVAKFINGIQDGTTKFYYESGNLKTDEMFINGKRVGAYTVYYDDPELKIKAQADYDSDGKAHDRKVFFANGEQVICVDKYNAQIILATYANLVQKFDIDVIPKPKEEKYVRKAKAGGNRGRSPKRKKFKSSK